MPDRPQSSDHPPPRLIPRDKAFVHDASLSRIAPDLSVAAWTEEADGQGSVCWRAIQNGAPGAIHSFTAVEGAPGSPKVRGPVLLWVEFREMKGTLFHRAIDADSSQVGQACPVEPLRDLNCGEFACVTGPEGLLWVFAEVWTQGSVDLALLFLENGEWTVVSQLQGAEGFCLRPRIAARGEDLLMSWDEYAAGTYQIATLLMSSHGSETGLLPTRPGCSETLSSIACSGDGTWFAARSRERPVHIGEGIASYHSELVVAARSDADGNWLDVAAVDIDHAMNPWLAPYCGLRRFPSLVGREKGVWLLWEEKKDVKEMYPPLGRLCALALDTDGAQGSPFVALDDESMLIVEEGAFGDRMLVAARTRREAWQNRIPYDLRAVDLGSLQEARPTELETNQACAEFAVQQPAGSRARLAADGLQLFFGDPHIHSRWSQDLDGEQDELYHVARDLSQLDFVSFAENDTHWFASELLSRATWERNRRNAEFFNCPGEFSMLLSYEYTQCAHPDEKGKVTSHRCVMFPGIDGNVHTWFESEDTPDSPSLARKFHGRRVLLHHHHPGGYDITDDSVERNIEICSGWWNCMLKPGFVESLHGLLGEGHQLGFFGASDNHERTPGLNGALTGVWATENTREAIFDAFWNRRVFATTGLRPDLRFRVSGAFMGGSAETDEPPVIDLSVECETPIRKVEVLRDGVTVLSREFGESKALLEWQDETCEPGRHFYYAHVLFDGHEAERYWNIASAYGVHAWTSPVWVEVGK